MIATTRRRRLGAGLIVAAGLLAAAWAAGRHAAPFVAPAAAPAVVAAESQMAGAPSATALHGVAEVAGSAPAAGCVAGAYVTGDLVGDANPAEVYATLCGAR